MLSTTPDSPYTAGTAAWEPVAAALMADGLEAWVDDGGHANYGIYVKIGTDLVDAMFIGAEPGEDSLFGYSLTDDDGFLVGGMALASLDEASTPQQIAAAIAVVARDLAAGRNLDERGYGGEW